MAPSSVLIMSVASAGALASGTPMPVRAWATGSFQVANAAAAAALVEPHGFRAVHSRGGDRAPRAVSQRPELVAPLAHHGGEQPARRRLGHLGDEPGDALGGVAVSPADGLVDQLFLATGEVVLERSARRLGVCGDIPHTGRGHPVAPDELGRAEDHALAGAVGTGLGTGIGLGPGLG